MSTFEVPEHHHGVFMKVSGVGVLIIGEPGIGKSNLALELLHHGAQLIADDNIAFSLDKHNNVVGHCPDILSGLLHSRELGLISVPDIFGQHAWQQQAKLDYIIQLNTSMVGVSQLQPEQTSYQTCGKSFAMLSLDKHSTASLLCRILTWLTMQSCQIKAEQILHHRQLKHMVIS